MKHRRHFANLFILAVLFLITVDAIPPVHPLHQRIKQPVDTVVDALGIWQGTWQLFAPNADKVNIRISAILTHADGSQSFWVSPDWSAMSVPQRFVRFREMEFFDSIRLDTNRDAWDSFADYIAREESARSGHGSPLVQVALTRSWYTIPPPDPAGTPALPPSAPPPFSHYPFHTLNLPPHSP